MKRTRPLCYHTIESIRLLCQMIRVDRRQRKWSESELATRMGSSDRYAAVILEYFPESNPTYGNYRKVLW